MASSRVTKSDRGLTAANPCERGEKSRRLFNLQSGRLYRGSRAEKIWRVSCSNFGLEDITDVLAPTIQRFLAFSQKVVPLIYCGYPEIVPA